MNARGSLSLEGVAAVLLSSLTLALLLQIARSSVAHLWFDHVLYQALICVAEKEPAHKCQQQAQVKAQQLPLGTQKIRIQLWKNGKDWQGDIKWQGPLRLTGHHRQSLALAELANRDSRLSTCCF